MSELSALKHQLKASQSLLAEAMRQNGMRYRTLKALYVWLITVNKIDPNVEGLDACILLVGAALSYGDTKSNGKDKERG